jgi:SnoaL-like protein
MNLRHVHVNVIDCYTACDILKRTGLAQIDRFTWLVTAAVALLAVTALASLLINRPGRQSPDLSTPGGVVTAFVQAIQAQQADQAWDLLAPEAVQPGPGEPRRPISKDEFRQEVQYSQRQTSSRIRITSVTQTADTATVQLEITDVSGDLLSGANSHAVTVSLRRQGASWRIISDPSPWQFQ